MTSAAGAVPAPLRTASLVLGALLLLAAVRLLLRRRSAAPEARPRLVRGAVVRCSVRVSQRTGFFQRPRDETMPALRVAVAPRCWPARLVAAAIHDEPHTDVAAAMPGVRLGAALLGAGLVGAASLPFGPVTAVIAAGCAAVPASYLPDAVLARAARNSLRAGSHDVAAALDMVAAAAAAGLPLRDALEHTAAHAPPAVAAALRATALRLATGGDPRTALTREADRFRLPVLADIGDAVERQQRLGAPLASELRRIAARQRASERARILEHAARRGPLGTLLVAMVIAPVCVASIGACVVGGLLESGSLGLR